MNPEIDVTNWRIVTPRLVLRPWKEEDLEDFYSYAKVDGVGQMAGWTPHKDREESRSILHSFIRGKHTLALELEGKVIGSLGIEAYNEGHYPELANLRGREIGYVLSREYWGRGLMPEAVEAVCHYLLHTLQLDFLLVGHFAWNSQSRRVIEKCGFHYIKTVPYETRYATTETCREYILRRENPHFMASYTPKSDEELVQEIYRRYDESSRLTKSKAASVEFLTNVHFIAEHLRPGNRILDVGAGTGAYSCYFASKGYDVTAVELTERNLEALKSHKENMTVHRGNALDLHSFEDKSFDAVLLMGPLYHLHSWEDRLQAIREAKRVCKPEGKLFIAFISNDIVLLTMQQTHPTYFLHGAYDKVTFRLEDFPFVFHTLDRCRDLLREAGVSVSQEIASDGVTELIQATVNAMDEDTFQQYMRYHLYLCQKPESIGMSNHWLFIGR